MTAPIAVAGAGAVGALLATLLTRAGHPVVVVAREGSAERLAADGLRVSSVRFGELTARPPVVTRLEEPVGAVLLAVKAAGLADALDRIDVAPPVVVPLLNGVEHLAVLRARFGERALGGAVFVQAHRDAPGHVVHRAPFLRVALAAPGAPSLAAALRDADVEVDEGRPEADVLWGKLSRLCALALATAAAGRPLGAVRADAEACAAEVVAVAGAEGAAVALDEVLGQLRGLGDDASSSLAADVAAGVPDHELDAIGGAVLRAAARHGLATPVTARLVAAVATRAR